MSASTFTHDVLLIGQGLAGTVLSETLLRLGKRVMVFDVPLPGRASAVAAGLVNPVVLRRTVLSWRASEMLAIAGAFYRELGLRHDSTYWHPMPLVALFPTAQEAGIWQLRRRDPEMARFLRTDTLPDTALDALPQPYGRGVVDRCAWVEVGKLLAAHRGQLQALGALDERRVVAADIRPVPGGVEVHGCAAPLVVHCAGPFQAFPGAVPVRGEGLTVRIPGLRLQHMVHRGVFLIPIGDDVYRVGATYAWDAVWDGATGEARRWLLDGLARLTDRPIEVLDQWCGVRPASKDRRPVLGRIAPHEAILNGLGSRGVILAPWCAQHLCDHLFEGLPLDPEVDVARSF